MNSMPKFTYVGEDKEGKKIEETVEANDRFDVYEIARQSALRASYPGVCRLYPRTGFLLGNWAIRSSTGSTSI